MGKKKNKTKVYKDDKGEYIKKWYFLRGKQKYYKVYVIDGIPADEFYEQNADPITLLQDEQYELLHEQGY